MVRDVFDLVHLNPDDSAKEPIKTAVANLRAGRLITVSMNRLISLAKAKNPHAKYILGSIHEFGLFGQHQNDSLTRQYYAKGSKFHALRNSEWLSAELGLNASVWLDLQLKMGSADTLQRAAQGRSETRSAISHTLFALAWSKRKSACSEANCLFLGVAPSARRPQFPSRSRGRGTSLKKWYRRDTDDSRFVAGVIDVAGHVILPVVLVALLYIAIGARVRLFCRAPAGEELSDGNC
jgi:hypothetical protein